MVDKRVHLGALGFYFLLSLWLTWPLAPGLLDQVLIGGRGIFFFATTPDPVMFVWNHWWVAQAVSMGNLPFVTAWLYYPEGLSLYLQTINYATTLPMVPITLWLGPVAAYNLSNLLGYQLTGYAGFLLARRYVTSVGPSLLAGVLLTATPFHVAKFDVGQLNFVASQWFFLAFVALVALSEGGNIYRLLAVACTLALTALTDWYLAIVIAFFAFGWAILVSVRQPKPLRSLGWFAGGGILSLGLLSPLLPGLLAARGNTDRMVQAEVWDVYVQGYSADALGLLFPAAMHPLWGESVERFLISLNEFGIMEGSYYASGWVLLLLGIVGALWHGRQHWPWLVITACAWLFAVGPTLHILGLNTGVPMPYGLLQSLPFLETARRPGLFLLIAHVALAVFAALALERMGAGMSGAARRGLWIGILALATFELSPGPRRSIPTDVAPVYAIIVNERPGVVVDLPIEHATNSRTLLHQLVHQQPILRGYTARAPKIYHTLHYAPLVYAFGKMEQWPEEDVVAHHQASWQRQQCFYRLRHVVVEERLVTDAEYSRLLANLEYLTGSEVQPWYQADGFSAYELPLYADQCAPFTYLGTGWHPYEGSGAWTWRWTNGASEFYLVNPHPMPMTVTLSLVAAMPDEERDVVVRTEQEQFALLSVDRQIRHYQLVLPLAPGANRIVLESSTNYEVEGGRELGVMIARLAVH